MAKFLKSVLKDEEARTKMLKGMNLLADAVGSTLGPRSRNVAVDKVPDQDVPPLILHDGVSVAKSINLPDPHEDMGARLLKGASLKTNEKAGDGTTGSTIIAQSLVNEAFKQIAAGVNPMVLKKEIEEALKGVLEELKSLSIPVTTEDYAKVASISAGDEEIGKLVAEVIEKVGKEGVTTIEEGKSFETTIEYKEGMTIDRGYLSPYFVTNKATVEGTVEDPFILLTDKKINYSHEIMPFLEAFVKAGHKNLVIFAGEVVEEGLATLVINRIRGILNVMAVQAPAFGGRRVDELEDIASFTGGQVILEESGRTIAEVQIEELGKAKKITSDRDTTKIFEGSGDTAKRIKELKEQIKIANSPYDTEIKHNRVANLSGKIAVISVGGLTEVEISEKKERVIDAVSATKSAIEEGIVAGGEVTLLQLASNCKNLVLANALNAPFKKLIENSGLDYADVKGKIGAYPSGIDVTDGQVKDLLKAGIIDPALVVKSAIQNAVSVATMFMTTNYIVADYFKDE